MPPQLTPVPKDPVDMIGYIRVSFAREEMISPEIQKATIADAARRTGRRIIDWVYDLDKSGRNFKRKITKAISRVENGEVAGILVWRYDRWGRNAAESLANIKRVELVGGVVESATEPLDPETAIGRYNRTNALALAEMQSDLIGETWRAAHSHRLAQGLPSGGGRRFGYDLVGRTPDPVQPHRTRKVPNVEERYVPDYYSDRMLAVVLGDCYCQYVAGATMQSIRMHLNDAGILNAHGRRWSDQTLTSYLDSGFAAGLLRVHDPECRCKKRNCKRHIYIQGAHEPVIDETLWEAYLQRRKIVAGTPARTLNATYPLTGLVRCGQCHGPMTITGGYKYRCVRQRDYKDCRGSWPRRAALEEAVLDRLREWAADIERHKVVGRAQVARRDAAADAAEARRQLAEVDRALAELVKQKVRDPDMPEAAYEIAKADLVKERADAEARLARAEAEAERHSVQATDYQPIMEGLLAEWDLLPPGRRRAMLATLIRHVKSYRTGPRQAPRLVVTAVWEDCDDPCCQTAGEEAPLLGA